MPQTTLSPGKAEADCDCSWTVPLSQHYLHRFLSPAHINIFPAAWPNSEQKDQSSWQKSFTVFSKQRSDGGKGCLHWHYP